MAVLLLASAVGCSGQAGRAPVDAALAPDAGGGAALDAGLGLAPDAASAAPAWRPPCGTHRDPSDAVANLVSGTGAFDDAPPGVSRALCGDRDEELRAFTRRCRQGHAASCSATGYMLERGIGAAADFEAAASAYERSCARGVAQDCASAAALIRRGDARRALRLLARGCDGGWAPACLGAAEMLEAGEGGRGDPARARALHRRAEEIATADRLRPGAPIK